MGACGWVVCVPDAAVKRSGEGGVVVVVVVVVVAVGAAAREVLMGGDMILCVAYPKGVQGVDLSNVSGCTVTRLAGEAWVNTA